MLNIQLVLFLFSFLTLLFPSIKSDEGTILISERNAYFLETAFYNQNYLYRWNSSIRVQCVGNYTNTDRQQIISMIDDIKNNLGEINIELVNYGGNLIFHFENDLDHFNINELKNQQTPFGYMKPQINNNHEILSADIYIHPSLRGAKKFEALRHEFCHSLGLMSHSTRAYYTENLLGKIIFRNTSAYNYWKSNQHIPLLDKEAIKILYQPELSLYSTKQSFERLLKRETRESHFTVNQMYN